METKTVQKLGLFCVSIALCSAASWWNGNMEMEHQAKKIAELPAAAVVQPVQVTVCVSGAVAKPGIYQVEKGSRANQAIELAGGVTGEADMDRVNLAQLCKDGGHIKVPRLSPARLRKKMAAGSDTAFKNGDGKTGVDYAVENVQDEGNITGKSDKWIAKGTGYDTQRKANSLTVHLNSASEAELEQLPGVGKSTARQIVIFRNRKAFQRIEDVMLVPGIGPAKFEKMRDCLAL